jgi:hypothetical protein
LVYKEHFSAIAEPDADAQMTPEATAAWNKWFADSFAAHFEPQRCALCDGIAAAVLELIDEEVRPLQKKIRSLERQLKPVQKGRR